MRISDWSSDVCSSDLDGAKLDPLLRRSAVAGRLARALEWRSLAPARARTDRSSWPAPRRRAALLGRDGRAGPPLHIAALRPVVGALFGARRASSSAACCGGSAVAVGPAALRRLRDGRSVVEGKRG